MAAAKTPLEKNEAYYAGFHWDSWIGPKMQATSPDAVQVMEAVQRVFQSSNKIAECVDRYRRALTAKPAAWKVIREGAEVEDETITQEIEQQLAWMLPKSSRERVIKPSGPEQPVEVFFPNAISQAMHYRLLGGKGYLRLWQPGRFENSSEAFRRVALHAPDPGSVKFVEDDEGFPYQVRYTYQKDKQRLVEVQEVSSEDGLTYFWTESADQQTKNKDPSEDAEIEKTPIDLGGRFSIVRLQGTPIVSEPIRRLQDGINYVLTLMLRNLQFGGFLRDIVSNGLPPGSFDDAGNFVPDPNGWVEGPGQKVMLQGLPIYGEDGNITGYTTPQVQTQEPVNIQSFIDSIQVLTKLIYENFGQGHILASDMSMSGVARVQLRSDFDLALAEDEAALRMALSDLYTVAYLLAHDDTATGFSIAAEPRLAVADPSSEEIGTAINLFNAKLLSQYSSMQAVGVEHPEDELERIDAETETNLRAREPSIEGLTAGSEDGPTDDDPDSDLDNAA